MSEDGSISSDIPCRYLTRKGKPMRLRNYQTECVDSIESEAANGTRKQLAVLPTGTGKTVIFTELAKRRQLIGRTLILVHRDELVRQTVSKFRDSGMDNIGIIEASHNDVRSPVTVASVQTLSRDARLIQYLKHGKAHTIITDEAHHAPAQTYRKVVQFCLHELGIHVGLTATPDRETQKQYRRRMKNDKTAFGISLTAGMGSVFDKLVYYRPLTDMIAEGWLSDIVPATVQTATDLHNVKMTAGDWQEGELGKALEQARADIDIVSAWERSARGRATIAFLPTVKTSRLVASEFERRGYTAEHVDGNTPNEIRQDIYKRLREGRTQVVTNCMILTEGFDEPSVSCIIVGRPTQSRLSICPNDRARD